MLRIKAFQGLRPAPDLVAEVACVPYDVVNRDESAALAAGKPQIAAARRSRGDRSAAETDPYSRRSLREERAKNFLALQESGALLRESRAVHLPLPAAHGQHVQTGLAAVCHIEDYEQDIIKKHEKTRRDKEDDRTRLIGTLSADTGPVFLTYRDTRTSTALVATRQTEAPLYDFTAPDGIQHTVWRIAGGDALCRSFSSKCRSPMSRMGITAPPAPCASGASAARQIPQHTGDEEYNWFLAVLFPASQLQILPYNRAVKDLHGHSKEAFLAAAAGLRPHAVRRTRATPARPGEIRMYLDGAGTTSTWHPPADADPIAQLDVTALQDRLLAPLLGIDDPRTSKRIDFIGGIRGTDELVRLVDCGKAAVAFSMYPDHRRAAHGHRRRRSDHAAEKHLV